MAYSVHTSPPRWLKVPSLRDLVCILLPFMVYFVYLLLLGELFIWVIFNSLHLDVLLVTFSVHVPSLGDLYIGNIFIHKLFLWAVLYVYFSLVSLSLLERYFMTTSLWWPILYTKTPRRPIFCTSDSSRPNLYTSDFNGLFHLLLPGAIISTYFMIILWWPILYTYFISVTYSVHMDIFEGLFYW